MNPYRLVPISLCLLSVMAFPFPLAHGEPVAPGDLEARNLLINPTFATAGKDRSIRSWSIRPSDTDLIRSLESADGPILEMLPGAASLSITSRSIPVEPETPYTLLYDLQQEDIHIGFGMGSRVALVWQREDGRSPESFDFIDGSFDWETMTLSVTSPKKAKSLTIRFQKKGSPGKISFRNARLSKGTLSKTRQELQQADFLRAEAAFEIIRTRIGNLMADKSALSIPEANTAIQRLEEGIATAVTEIRADLKSAGFQPTPDEKGRVVWVEMLKGNVGFRVPPSSPYHASWKALGDELADLHTVVAKWVDHENTPRLKAAMQQVFGQIPPYAIGVDSTMLKIRRDAPYTGAVASKASLALARNEEEGVQITVAALDHDLENVSLDFGDFKTADGTLLPKEVLTIHRIDFVKTNPPQYDAAGPVGWWPDVVFPARNISKIAKGSNQAFWVTVATDAKTPAGDYTGEVTVALDGKTAQKVTLEVRVWDLTLPKPGKFEVIGCFHPYMLKNFYRWKTIKEDVVAQWNRFIVKKRWNPTLYFSKDITPTGPALSAAIDEGLNAVNLLDPSKFLDRDESRTYTWPSAEQEKAMTEAVLASKAAFLAAGGNEATTKLFVSGFDEQHNREQYKLMKYVFDLVKKTVPGVQALTTTTYPPLDVLAGSVDTWVPLLGSESEDLRQRQQAGDQLHFYVYAHPYRPFPNPSLIDYPGIDGRVTFWVAARKGYTGFLHYLFNGWKMNNDLPGPRWPQTDWLPYASENQKVRNGSGYFIYPGPDEQPISSVRMELVRDGIEDWELITLLQEKIKEQEQAPNTDAPALAEARAALAAGFDLVPALDHFTYETGPLLSARTRIAEAVIALEASSKKP